MEAVSSQTRTRRPALAPDPQILPPEPHACRQAFLLPCRHRQERWACIGLCVVHYAMHPIPCHLTFIRPENMSLRALVERPLEAGVREGAGYRRTSGRAASARRIVVGGRRCDLAVLSDARILDLKPQCVCELLLASLALAHARGHACKRYVCRPATQVSPEVTHSTSVFSRGHQLIFRHMRALEPLDSRQCNRGAMMV